MLDGFGGREWNRPPRLVLQLVGFWADGLGHYSCALGVKERLFVRRVMLLYRPSRRFGLSKGTHLEFEVHPIGPLARHLADRIAAGFELAVDRIVLARKVALGLEVDLAAVVGLVVLDDALVPELQDHLYQRFDAGNSSIKALVPSQT
jgi:hypothetical protein